MYKNIFKWYLMLCFFIVGFVPNNSFAQLSGTKTVGTGGDYLTIEAAITDHLMLKQGTMKYLQAQLRAL